MNDGDSVEGHIHPITHIIRQTADIFSELGFTVASGPEIETEWYNFDALNIPSYHPARDMWDTFWLKPRSEGKLLRTHTSPVQVRFAENHKPPIRIIVPGKTFRHEATDATHEAQFFQLEGLMIEKDVSMANLKFVLEYYFERLFGSKVLIRFRPSYFPFVEPGVEIDMQLIGETAPAKLKDKWIEIMGAGMVHPKVLNAMGIDSSIYSGFAFGGGIDRFAMLKFGIEDIRDFYKADLRFINQF